MQKCEDDVRHGFALQGAARIKLERLYPEKDEFDLVLTDDRKRFLRALDACCGEHLKVGEDQNVSIDKFPEPVIAVAARYATDLGLADVAAELDYDDAKLAVLFKYEPFAGFGLGPLTQQKVIKRESWEKLSPESKYSTLQEVAASLRLGTPIYVKPMP